MNRIPIFLSSPRPVNEEQTKFIDMIKHFLRKDGYEPVTLGVTDYGLTAPLNTIRRFMLECNGLITIALRRSHISSGKTLSEPGKEIPIANQWLTSPWSHIEPAMAFQVGLPILILRESGVIADGILDKGVTGLYMPEFNLDEGIYNYLKSEEWTQIFGEWKAEVRNVVKIKGTPTIKY